MNMNYEFSQPTETETERATFHFSGAISSTNYSKIRFYVCCQKFICRTKSKVHLEYDDFSDGENMLCFPFSLESAIDQFGSSE